MHTPQPFRWTSKLRHDVGMVTVISALLVVVVSVPLLVLLIREIAQGSRSRSPLISRNASSKRIAGVAFAVVLMLSAGMLASLLPLCCVAGDGEAASVGDIAYAIALFVLLAIYPTGTLVPRWIGVVAALASVLFCANALGGPALESAWLWPLPVLPPLLALVGAQGFRYLRRASVDERERARWPLLATLLALLIVVPADAVSRWVSGGSLSPAALTALSGLVSRVALLLPAVGFALGLLARRSPSVDRALRWLLWVAGSAIVFAAGYTAGVLTGSALGVTPVGAGWIGGGFVALLGPFVVKTMQRAADWLVYRGRPDPLATVSALGDRLSTGIQPGDVPDTIVTTVRDALGVASVVLENATGTLARAGEPEGMLPDGIARGRGEHGRGERARGEQWEISYRGAVLARLWVTPRPGESELTPTDRTLIAQLANHAAPALHGAATLEDLQRARSRLVLAREEERRRLRRDLHDDLAPSLVGLRLSALAIETLARTPDDRLERVAAELVSDIGGALRQVREIAHGLRPPVLDEEGLVGAIRVRIAARGSLGASETPAPGEGKDTEPRIVVTAPELRLELPPAVEVAALRIVQEAVTNVRQHARATLCRIEIHREPTCLVIAVTDNGHGFASTDTAISGEGLGHKSIRERASELGGTVDIRSGTTGTLVQVVLPTEDVVTGR